MKHFLTSIHEVAVAGFLFLLPVYVVLIVVTKAWTFFSSIGAQVAALFGMKSILGVRGSTLISGLLLVIVWIACGMLARFGFVANLSKRLENWLARYVPGYETYNNMAKAKLHNKLTMLPYISALVKQEGYWQPAYVVEQDDSGDYVIFVPNAPDTNAGHVLLAHKDQVRIVPLLTANQLDASLKRLGKGLLNEYFVQTQGHVR